MYRKLFCIICALLLSLLAGCSTSAAVDPALSAGPAPTPESDAAPPSIEPAPTPEPDAAPPSIEPAPASEPVEPYQFGTPLEESEPVEDDSFFDTAVFLGDSRTEGLQLFSGLKHGDFFWTRGMTVFRADSEDYRPFEIDGEEHSMIEALALKQYDSVYLMLGVNELGYSAESYEEGLGDLLDKILEVQPDAVVYLQIMPPLNDAMCRQHGLHSYINNVNLSRFNEAIVRLAAEKAVVLLDTAEPYTGPDGQLPAELANDGCHFAFNAYGLWADYLRTHVMDRARYFGAREQALG